MHTHARPVAQEPTRGEWDWEVAASLYDYGRDDKRQNGAANTQPGGAGGRRRHDCRRRRHRLEHAGLEGHLASAGRRRRARGRLRLAAGQLPAALPDLQHPRQLAGRWAGALASSVRGDTSLRSLYAQDAVATGRGLEGGAGWRAPNAGRRATGAPTSRARSALTYPSRRETFFSPKAALSWQSLPDTVLKASLGRAVRMPTVSELYGATSTTNSQYINDPNLRAREVVDHRAECGAGPGLRQRPR